MKRMIPALILSSVLVAPAATASTLPPVDFRAHQVTVALGYADANVDYALSDRLSLGVTAFYAPWSFFYDFKAMPTTAARATWRLGEQGGFAYGLTLSAGGTWAKPGGWFMNGSDYEYMPWGQLALNATVPLWGDWLKLRASVGPVLLNPRVQSYPLPLPYVWPNLELAARVAPGHELTLLGNGYVGWRGRF